MLITKKRGGKNKLTTAGQKIKKKKDVIQIAVNKTQHNREK